MGWLSSYFISLSFCGDKIMHSWSHDDILSENIFCFDSLPNDLEIKTFDAYKRKQRPLKIGLCILHHLTRSFLILAVWFRRDAKMQIFFYPSSMASSEEAALIYIVLWCITWIFQMLFLGNKCFHTLQFDIETVDKREISTPRTSKVNQYRPSEYSDGLSLVCIWCK